ncbi:diguanylate cyclase [Bradyrhizobium sp.]|uniref:diguanylate cyclase n=1 Tax=Bradyrhizobium sp. TaxID=376 RepID=UPI003C58557A
MRELSTRDAAVAAADVSLRNLARSLTQHVEDSFDLAEASIIGVSSRLEADGAAPDVISKLQKIVAARKAGSRLIHAFVIVDSDGNWLTSSGAIGSNVSDRAYFIHHKQSSSHDSFVGPAIKSSVTGDWIITLSRRFNRPDGSFAGVVVVTISTEYFSEFYHQFDIGQSGTVSLLSSDGIILARRPDNGTVGRDVSNGEFLRGIDYRESSGVYHFLSSLDGLQRIGAYQRSEHYHFTILVTKAQDEVVGEWRSAAMARTGFVLGLVVLIAIIGFYLVRQLIKGERMAAALASKEASFRALAEGSSDLVTRVGVDGTVQYASPSSIRVLGWRPQQLVGTQALAGINPEDLPRVEETVRALREGELEDARMTYRARHRKKSEVWVESSLRVTRTADGDIDGVVAILRDVTQQKDLEGRLETLATEDGLTGLSNRRHFDERLLQEFGRAYREHTSLGILMIDLDHFKQYNDEYGHLAGDECLRAFAKILSAEALRTTDLAARYGGEEFVMLLPNTDALGCARIGQRIRRALRDIAIPHVLNTPSGMVTASIGGAICRPGLERTAGPASLVDAADRALYSAKDGGRDQLVMAPELVTVLPAASALRRGIRELHEAR